MFDLKPDSARGTRRGTVAIICALAVLVIAAVVIGILAAQPRRATTAALSPSRAAAASAAPTSAAPTSAAPTSTAPAGATSAAAPSAVPSVAPSASAPAPSASSEATAAAPAPQPTKTAEIAKPAVIVKALTAKVTDQAAVAGTAQGPGEIAGPSVQFTIRISNTTGKTVDLASAVVNAYYGTDRTPASQLEEPGGHSFPESVKDGDSATGVFVFTIPSSQRGTVLVTLDTSVANAVVAFKGASPN